jgi:hypothetical protein
MACAKMDIEYVKRLFSTDLNVHLQRTSLLTRSVA